MFDDGGELLCVCVAGSTYDDDDDDVEDGNITKKYEKNKIHFPNIFASFPKRDCHSRLGVYILGKFVIYMERAYNLSSIGYFYVYEYIFRFFFCLY